MQKFFDEYGKALIACICTVMIIVTMNMIFAELKDIKVYTKPTTAVINQNLQGISKPDIQTKNQRIVKGNAFDPKNCVKVIDNYDGDITNKVQIFGGVNNNVKGEYKIRYVAENSKGMKAYKNIYVIVD